MNSSPSRVIIKEENFAKGLAGSGIVGQSSLGGTVSTQDGVDSSFGSSLSKANSNYGLLLQATENIQAAGYVQGMTEQEWNEV